MKKFLHFFAAVLAFVLVACSPEELRPSIETQVVTFGVEVDDFSTKTNIVPDANEVTFATEWVSQDKIGVHYETDQLTEDEEGFVSGTNVCATYNGGSFSAAFPVYKGAWSYNAYYPYQNTELVVGESVSIPFGSARVQNGNKLNPAYDIMYGTVKDGTYLTNADAGKDDNGDAIKFTMQKSTALLYFHLTGSYSGSVESATLTVEGADLCAPTVNLTTSGDYTGWLDIPEDTGEKTISLSFEEGTNPSADNLVLWFNIMPDTFTKLTLVVETEGKVLTLVNSTSTNYVAGKIYKISGNATSLWKDKVTRTIQWEAPSDWNGVSSSTITFSDDRYGYTVTGSKSNAGTNPTVVTPTENNSYAKDCRIYAGGTVTVSNNNNPITSIIFNLSTQGLKRLAPITASVGTISDQQSGDKTVVWSGYSTSVTFSVGDKATYGSDSNSNGQLCFDSIDAIYIGDAPTVINVETVSLSQSNATMVVGDKLTLTATVTPSAADNKTVVWSSENTGVATVENGVVTAISAGTVTITATTVDGAKTASCAITVTNPETKTVDQWRELISSTDKNNPSSFNFVLNEATVTYVSGKSAFMEDSSRGIYYYSSAEITNISAGDKISGSITGTGFIYNGLVEVVSLDLSSATIVHNCDIPVTTVTKNELSDNYDVYVSRRIKLENVAVIQDPKTIAGFNAYTYNSVSLTNGLAPSVIVYPGYFTNKQLTVWESFNISEVTPTGISLDAESITLTKGKRQTLTATVTPVNATNKNVIWTTSDAAVATVSNGVVSAVGAGSATITAKLGANESVNATCAITVEEPTAVVKTEQVIYSVGFESDENFTAGNNYQGTVTYGPEGKQWKLYYGNFSTSSCISGSQSIALRLYTSNNYGTATMNFDLEEVTKVTYKVKAATSNSAKIKLNTYYSKDGGENWVKVDDAISPSSTASEKTMNISSTGEFSYVRIKFEIASSSTKPSKSSAQLTIDDVKVYGMKE